MDEESSGSPGQTRPGHSRPQPGKLATLMLAYQSFGIVYGDLSVSPLYVFRNTFSREMRGHIREGEILGVLSLIFWTFTLVPVVKYALIVLKADDNGEGGTFALYSLLCRHAKLNLILNQQSSDTEVSNYKVVQPPETPRGKYVQQLLETHPFLRVGLLVVVLLGTCMVIGDGILTPSISVLSAISGISVAAPQLHQNVVVLVSCVILVLLFAMQHFGTRRISFVFAPVVLAWLLCNCSIGVYNLVKFNPGIVRALSPYYIYQFFKESGRNGWISLGGVLLCITGSEAMYADLGHFSRTSIKIAFLCVVYPTLLVGYMGQAAYLSKNLEDVDHGFFHSIPKPVFWPVFLIATLASIVGSQAVISATFSIIKQCQSLGCFPWVKVVHTSHTIHGQIYIPEINWMMLVLTLSVTVGFRSTIDIGNAYGIAVIAVMLVTTFLTALVILIVWNQSLATALAFLTFFGSIEALYLSSALFKVPQGGWVPLALAALTMAVMFVWHYGTTKKNEFEEGNKVSMKWLLEGLGGAMGPGVARVPGMGLVYTETVTGVPAVFSHFVTNLPAFHRVLVFVCLKSVGVPRVPEDERFLVGRVGPRDYRMYRCVIRHGYKDFPGSDDTEFENQLVFNLVEFIQTEGSAPWVPSSSEMSLDGRMTVVGRLPALNMNTGNTNVTGARPSFSCWEAATGSRWASERRTTARTKPTSHYSSSRRLQSLEGPNTRGKRQVSCDIPLRSGLDPEMLKELQDIIDAKEAGIAYVLGRSDVKAKKPSPWLKKFAINIIYTFLHRNCRQPAKALHIPHASLIEVGMVYYV